MNKKQNQSYKYREQIDIAREEGRGRTGKISEVELKIQVSSYGINKLWE